MSKDHIKILEEIYEDYLHKKKEAEENLQKLLDRKEELNVTLHSVSNHEDADLFVFSPRTSESRNKEIIKSTENDIKNINNEIDSYYQYIKELDLKITQLMKLIGSDDIEFDIKRLKILDIQEKERSRVARELHDTSLQNLAHLIHMIELSSIFIDQDPIRAKLELSSCIKHLRQVIDDIRDTIFDLRPMSFDDLGFSQCLDNYFDTLKKQYTNCEFVYEVDEINFSSEDNEAKAVDNTDSNALFLLTLYRVLQEAIGNALKHSGANQIQFYLKDDNNQILINIIDNGKGFSKEDIKNKEKHFGISIMQERIYLLSGKITIHSDLNKGTRIEIAVPKP